MPDLYIEYAHISNTAGLQAVTVLRAVDEALPTPTIAIQGPYIAGIVQQGGKASEKRTFAAGPHYVIVGVTQNTTATIQVRVKTLEGKTIKEKTVSVTPSQYYVVGFGVNADDPNIDGAIAPGEEPDIEPAESSTSTTLGIDPKFINDMMSMMMQMMMMVMMMSVMMGMMRGLAGAFGGV